jgi:predicted nucleic acid-binding protein
MVGYYRIGEMKEMEMFLAKSKLEYKIMPVSLEIAQEGAELRALYAMRLPDALILATAKLTGAEYLISNDIQMKKSSYMSIVTVEEFAQQCL